MKEEIEKLRARNAELEANYSLLKDALRKKTAILNKQNEEIKILKKEVNKLTIYQMKLGEE